MRHRLSVILLLAACLCLSGAGCSKQAPFDVAPVHGSVTIDGQPLVGGNVMFAPVAKAGSVEAGKPGLGNIESDGSFVLRTYGDRDGAVVGDHWVTVFSPRRGAGQDANAASISSDLPDFRRLKVPQKQTVLADQDNQIDIRLTRQDVARYGRAQ